MKIVGATGLSGLWALEWAWHIRYGRLRNLNLRSPFSIFAIFRDMRVYIYGYLKFVGGLWTLKGAWVN